MLQTQETFDELAKKATDRSLLKDIKEEIDNEEVFGENQTERENDIYIL